jgi:PEP-CTERM motif
LTETPLPAKLRSEIFMGQKIEGQINMKTRHLKPICVAALSAVAVAATAGVLYDNTQNQTGNVMTLTNNQEVGDQIFLANYTTFPYLTNFSIEYYSPDVDFSSPNQTITADVKFYLNDGLLFNGYDTPNTVFYDSGQFDIYTPNHYFAGTNSAVLSFSLADLQGGLTPLDPNFLMPSNFTVSVTFNGLNPSKFDIVGLNIFEPPVVGSNFGDYWLKNGANWELLTNNTTPVAFAMQLNGQQTPTPEPGTLCLIGLGAAALVGFARRRRQ